MSHASEPGFVLCGRHGPFAFAYAGNYGAFDPDGKGYITVQDLTDRIQRVTTGPRWQEIADRIGMARRDCPTQPEILITEDTRDRPLDPDDPPVFILPGEDG